MSRSGGGDNALPSTHDHVLGGGDEELLLVDADDAFTGDADTEPEVDGCVGSDVHSYAEKVVAALPDVEIIGHVVGAEGRGAVTWGGI